MVFSIFGRTKQYPLTELCTKLSTPANLLKSANHDEAVCAANSPR